MSVGQLLLICEGQEQGLDALVLGKVVRGLATITPEGSKQDLPHRFFWYYQRTPQLAVAVLRDRDFDHLPNDLAVLNTPRPLAVNEKGSGALTPIGRTWERVEIENYLIDPVVVEEAHGRQIPGYREALEKAAAGLGPYTAARLALSAARNKHTALSSSWKQPFGASPADCRSRIIETVAEYSKQHQLDARAVVAQFDGLLPECEPGGARASNALVFFSGKDLLAGMQSSLQRLKLNSGHLFVEEIATRISDSREDVWTWLPEWQALRDLVEQGGFV